MRHPECFTKESGVERLLALVHGHDDMMRWDSFRSWQMIQDLKDKLASRT